jgi:hypothetical protein
VLPWGVRLYFLGTGQMKGFRTLDAEPAKKLMRIEASKIRNILRDR